MREQSTVSERPTTAAERRAILDEYDSYPRGDSRRGALLRRYGLYSSTIAKWRERLRAGDAALEAHKPGPTAQAPNPLQAELAQLQREHTRLKAQLAKAELIIDVQKNVATLLGLNESTGEPS